MGVIKGYKQTNFNGGFRIARIQYHSNLKNQNLYSSHRYKIKVVREHVYSPSGYINEIYCVLYCSKNGIVAEVTNNDFYIIDNGNFVDVCLHLNDNFTRLHIEIETSEIGSVSMKLDKFDISNATRLKILNPVSNSMFNKLNGINFCYYHDYSTTIKVKLNNTESFKIDINGDYGIIMSNSVAKSPNNWTLTKGDDILINGEIIGSEYILTTPYNHKGIAIIS